MYYLNSRYYNPEIGRFINADGQIGQPGDILGHNMYAYAMNNPVMMVDPNGYLAWYWELAIGIGVGILIPGAGGLIATLALGAFEGAATQVIINAIDGQNLTDGIGYAAIGGAIGAGISYGVGKFLTKTSYETSSEKLINSDDVSFSQKSLDKAFEKHSSVFGEYPDGTKSSVDMFRSDIKNFIDSETNMQKYGTYRGKYGIHVYNESRQWVFITQNCEFDTGFRLNINQFYNLVTRGSV